MSEARMTSRGIEVTPQATQPVGPVDRLVVATTWYGPLVLDRLHAGEPDPTPEELAAMAADLPPYGGVKPYVRVIEPAPFGHRGPAGSAPR